MALDLFGSSGTMVNFSSGIVDWSNPLTWPLVADIGEIPDISVVADIYDEFVKAAKAVPILGPIALAAIDLALKPLQLLAPDGITMSIQGISDFLRKFGKDTAGLAELNAYIGHANVGLVPQILGSNIPVLNLLSGPPYPVIISRGGVVSSFAAEFDAIASVNISLILSAVSGGIFANAITIYNFIAKNVNEIFKNLDAIRALGLPVPKFPEMPNIATTGTLNLYATLLHLTASNKGPCGTQWNEVAKLDLGTVDLAQCALLDNISDVLTGAGRSLGGLLHLDLTDKSQNTETSNFKAGVMAVKNNYKVYPGDYLMVQFGMDNKNGLTIAAGAAGTNASASITIE